MYILHCKQIVNEFAQRKIFSDGGLVLIINFISKDPLSHYARKLLRIHVRLRKWLTSEIQNERISSSFLVEECQIIEFFSAYHQRYKEIFFTHFSIRLVQEQWYVVQFLRKHLNFVVHRSRSSTVAAADNVAVS